jgi:hypothetical protein
MKENMGQCESKERDFKEEKRSKVLKKDFRRKALKNKRSKRREQRKEVTRLLCVSEHPAHLTATLVCPSPSICPFCISSRPPVRFSRNGAQESPGRNPT